MTDLTIRQILDAMTRALDETARRFADRKPERLSGKPQPPKELEDAADQSFDSGRAG
jgi:hypothetical protein